MKKKGEPPPKASGRSNYWALKKKGNDTVSSNCSSLPGGRSFKPQQKKNLSRNGLEKSGGGEKKKKGTGNAKNNSVRSQNK